MKSHIYLFRYLQFVYFCLISVTYFFIKDKITAHFNNIMISNYSDRQTEWKWQNYKVP